MKIRTALALLPALSLLLASAPAPTRAGDWTFPVFNADAEGSPWGIRISLGDTTSDFLGLDLGLHNRVDRDFDGIAIDLAHTVRGTATGAQVGWSSQAGKADGLLLQLGIANHAGTGTVAQVGAFNVLTHSGSPWQVGLINHGGTTSAGAQLGLINLGGQACGGLQVGFINRMRGFSGVSVGTLNLVDEPRGLSVGVVNAALRPGAQAHGWRLGVCNADAELAGRQIGLVNLTRTSRGGQIGLYNHASHFKKGGFQIGLVNTMGEADPGENTSPVTLLFRGVF